MKKYVIAIIFILLFALNSYASENKIQNEVSKAPLRNSNIFAVFFNVIKSYDNLCVIGTSQKDYVQLAKEHEDNHNYFHAAYCYEKANKWKQAYDNLHMSMKTDKETGNFEFGSLFIYYPRLFIYATFSIFS